MKKLFLLMGMAAAMINFAGCQKNEIDGVDNTNKGGSTFELIADIAQTKTTLDAEYNVAWEEDDVIYVVTTDETWGKPYSNDNPGDETIADFTYSDGKFNITSEFGGWMTDYLEPKLVEDLINSKEISYIYSFKEEKLSDKAQKLVDTYNTISVENLNKLDNLSDSDRSNKEDYISIMTDNLDLLKKD